MSPLRAAVVPC